MLPAPASASCHGPTEMYQSDRREHQRYPISLDVEYKVLGGRGVQRKGLGRTINISAGGALLALHDPLPTSSAIELSIRWPFRLAGSIPLRLFVRGKIVRHDGNNIAVKFRQHEFYTVGSRR